MRFSDKPVSGKSGVTVYIIDHYVVLTSGVEAVCIPGLYRVQ